MEEVGELRYLAICPKVSAALSMLCSGYIAYSVMSNPQKRSVPKERIMLGLSCSDFSYSFFWFLTTWPIPSGSIDTGISGIVIPGASGNTQTCTMQGFFLQLGVMTPMYNGFLALYCFLYVCKDWGRQTMKYIEICGHLFILAFGFSTAIAGIALELYNNALIVCWISPIPFFCTQSFESIDGTTDCTRGDNSTIYRWAFFNAMVWLNILLSIYFFLQIYLYFRKQEKRMAAYTTEYATNTTTSGANSDSRKVAMRGALFTGAFFITHAPDLIAESFRLARSILSMHAYITLMIALSVLLTSQGMFNFFIYIQPAASRYFKEKRRRNEMRKNGQLTSDQKHRNHSGEEKEDISEGLTPAS